MFNREVSLGNVLTILSLLGSGILGYAKFETRVGALEAIEQARLVQLVELRHELRDIEQELKVISLTISTQQRRDTQ